MSIKRCLYCYQPLKGDPKDFHAACSKKMFGASTPPVLPYTETQMGELALQVVRSQIAVTGVQAKLSVDLQKGKEKNEPQRFTIVGLWGGYILKPPTANYPYLCEVEDLTMHLADIAKINTVPHSLIRLQSGTLAYITKRIDRVKKRKLHMEDMCQLTDRLTEDKYHGSYEQIAKVILKYSDNPLFDVLIFFEQVLFSFLTGNADMHLKNFSLISQPVIGCNLAPAYDMVATALVNPADKEDLALTLNAKKRKIKRADFIKAFDLFKIDGKQQSNLFNKFDNIIPEWINFIDASFLNKDMKDAYKALIKSKHKQLG